MAELSAFEAQELERTAMKWQRDDDLAGRPHRTIQEIKAEILRSRKADRMRQIKLAKEKLADWHWALENDMPEERFRAEAERRLEPLLADSPYLEWGIEFVLSEESHGPGKVVVYPLDNQGSAERTLNEDRVASGSSEPRGRVMYRRTAGHWKEAPRAY